MSSEQAFLKSPLIATLHSKYTRALTLENLSGGRGRGPQRHDDGPCASTHSTRPQASVKIEAGWLGGAGGGGGEEKAPTRSLIESQEDGLVYRRFT
jgi:hypothetical protein